MFAHVLEGPLPGGGEVALDNWSWETVTDERNAAGHIWGGPWHIVGTWDGAQLTLTRPPLAVPNTEAAPPPVPTPDCNSADFAETRERIFELDVRSIGLLTDNVLTTDGRCGILILAIVDTAELREQLAPFADDIAHYRFLLQPVSVG